MTPKERELLLLVAHLARNLGSYSEACEIRELAMLIRDDAAKPAPVHPMPDPDMEPPKAPPIPDSVTTGKYLDDIARENKIRRSFIGIDVIGNVVLESDADLRVRVLDAIARSASAPQGAPRQLSRYVVRYDETQTFQTTSLAWSPEEAVRDIQAKVDAGNSLGGREVDGAGPHNVRVVL